MYILSIIPLTKIPLPSPQVLDYFASEAVSCGGVVEISLHHARHLGIVLFCVPLYAKKFDIKQADFTLKAILRTLNPNEVISKNHLKLIVWASQYYYAPLGLVARTFLPKLFSKPSKKFLCELACFAPHHTAQNPKQVLVLVPELYKIAYLQSKFSYLADAPFIHSGVSPQAEYQIWKDAQNAKIQCLVGTRSCLAIHLPGLQKIIVKDADSPFYKSFDQQPYINAAYAARKLGELSGAQVILETSAPHAETYHAFQNPKLKIKNSTLTLIDMREELKNGNFSILSKTLQETLRETIADDKQAILFINRKGLATGLLCRDCGHIVRCPNCDIPFVCQTQGGSDPPWESSRGVRPPLSLICRHCSKKQAPPANCPKCHGYRVKFIGAGTQRVEQEVLKLFPAVYARRLDFDVAPQWEQQKKIFQDFFDKKFHILIGTQLIFKEELLPRIKLAAVITIDPLLSLPDFRMGEEVVRIVLKIQRVAAKVILQTYMPENYVMRAIRDGDLQSFYKEELENRKALSFPPFSQIIKLTYAHTNAQRAEQEAKILKNKLVTQIDHWSLDIDHFQVLGPSCAFIPRVKNRYIWQIMIKSKVTDLRLRNKVLSIVPSDWKIDVDPVEML